MTSIGLEGLGDWEAGKIGAERWAGKLRGWEIGKSKVLSDLPREGTHRGDSALEGALGWEIGRLDIGRSRVLSDLTGEGSHRGDSALED